jgi:ABC-2 type transport system ATP-binding protein
MSAIVTVRDVSKRYGSAVALDGVTFSLQANMIYGLLGRNGAGKTTLMQILTGQGFATSGSVEVFGAAPYENDAVLADVCFVKESQRYPDSFKVHHALHAAGLLFPNWDEGYAQSLVDDFHLPRKRGVRKLSRGMVSALGVVIGLASRSRLTFFDEPYLGLDAAARQLFYDHLLADYAEHPRTVVLSTHLIDEVAELIEHVLVLDRGRLVVDDAAERLRGQVVTVTGPAAAVDRFAGTRKELHRIQLGSVARATVRGSVDAGARASAAELGLEVEPVSLQQLVVRLTGANGSEPSKEMSR